VKRFGGSPTTLAGFSVAGSDKRDISLDTIVVASKDQVSSDLAGETVLLSLTSARYYGLSGVAARIWDLLREPVRASVICESIAVEFDVAPDRCEADTMQFLQELAKNGLIETRVDP